MNHIKRIIIAAAAVLGLVTVAPTLAPVATASVSGCHGDASHNPEGGWVWCDSQTQTNDRYRVKIECVEKVSPYRTTTRVGAASRAAYSSYAPCPSNYRIIGQVQVQFCDNYYSSPTTSTCMSPGWAYKQAWWVSEID